MKYRIVTISREHGSGGRLVGKTLANMLRIPMYDKKLIELAAQESGLSAPFIQQAEQRPVDGFLYELFWGGPYPSIHNQVFLAQSQAIQETADQGPCIIAGRCADYVLRERTDCLNVFIYAPMEEKIRRLREEYGEAENANKKYLETFDKHRSAYYNYFSDQKWGDYHNYHLSISTTLGIQSVANIIKEAMGEEERAR